MLRHLCGLYGRQVTLHARLRCAHRAFASHTPETHPTEFAIWRKLKLGSVDDVAPMWAINGMCRRLDCEEHAQFLHEYLDKNNDGVVTFEEFCTGFYLVRMIREASRRRQWNRTLGLGIAGNVAGHMEQAGEADAKSAHGPGDEVPATPAAVFAFYVPRPEPYLGMPAEVLRRAERLNKFPLASALIEFPHELASPDVQVEPELGLYADVVYGLDGTTVERLIPRRVAAFNDCSIRSMAGSCKLSEKKNWGLKSKGISVKNFKITSFEKGSFVDQLVLCSFVKRGNEIFGYSVPAPSRNYLMFNQPLLDWVVDRMNVQSTEGKWENVAELLRISDYPNSVWIALGAGEYTEWAQTNYIQPGDECVVCVYDEHVYPGGLPDALVGGIFEDAYLDEPLSGLLSLHQTFV